MRADHVVLARKGIIKTTKRGSRSITYGIELGAPDGPRMEVWCQTVHFTTKGDSVSGGPAFQATAREQDKIATEYRDALRALDGDAHP